MRALNGEVTRLTGKRLVDAIKEAVGLKEKRLDSSVNVRYLYTARELEGG